MTQINEPFSDQLPSETTYRQLSKGNNANHGTSYNNGGGNGNGNSYGIDGNQGNGKGNCGNYVPIQGDWILYIFAAIYLIYIAVKHKFVRKYK